MIYSCNIKTTWINHVISILHDLDFFVSILGWYHWQYNIDITKYRFYMAARIDSIVISKLAATDLLFVCLLGVLDIRRVTQQLFCRRMSHPLLYARILGNWLKVRQFGVLIPIPQLAFAGNRRVKE